VPELAAIAADAFAIYCEEVRESIHEWVAPLSTAQLWTRPYPYGNSVGHLLLHLTGNLNHYIGAHIAGTGYVRNRDREFNETAQIPKDQLLADFDRAVAMTISTIRAQSPADWCAPYALPNEPRLINRFAVFQRMTAHLYHHAGQIIYLSKELTKPAHGVAS
jgi:hypothetical protein